MHLAQCQGQYFGECLPQLILCFRQGSEGSQNLFGVMCPEAAVLGLDVNQGLLIPEPCSNHHAPGEEQQK